MTGELGLLLTTAVWLGVAHTLMGPDHYVPFVAMAQANDWSTRRSLIVTIACGLAHVLSSVVLGLLGLILGLLVLNLSTIQWIESRRGETAAWMLIAFGGIYLAYGIWKSSNASRNHQHQHQHLGSDDHPSVEEEHQCCEKLADPWSPWILFLVFAFGPCEALIPMLMYPAASANWFAVVAVVFAFGLATLLTMTGAVLLMRLGLRSLQLPDLHRYSHALAGAAVLTCGLAVKFGL